MAERKYKSANIATQTDTFGAWVDRTNQIVFDLSETVVTAQQNTVGGSTSGNVVITSNVYNQDTQAWVNSTGGILQSNTIAAFNDLRGGNVQVSNTLYVTSNSNLSNGTVAIQSSATVNTVTIKGSFTELQTTNVFANGTLLQVSSNVHINSSSTNTSINSTATHITGTTLDINSTTVDMDGTTLTGDYDNVTLTANDITLKSNSIISVIDINGDGTSSSVTLSGNLFTVDSDESQYNANVVFGSANSDTVTFNSEADSGLNPVSNALSLGLTDARWNLNSNTVSVSNTLSVTGNTSIGGKADVTGAIGGSSTLTIAGKTTLNADVDLGNANSDSVNFIGEVSSNINPEGNTQALGLNDARWILKANTINVSGTSTLTGNVTTGDTLSVGDNLIVATTSLLTGAANVGGLLRAKSGLITTGIANATSEMNVGANVNLSTTKISVGTSTSNTTITKTAIDTDGTLSVLGAAAVSNTLSAGNTTVTGFVDVSGNMKAGSANVTGGLQANGAVDFNDTLDVALAITAADTFTAGNVAITQTTLTVGDASVNAVIHSNGSILTDGSFVGDSVSTSGAAGIGTALSVGTSLGVTGATTLQDTLDVTGLVTGSAGLDITGLANVTGDVVLGDNLSVADGLTILASGATITGAVDITGAANVSSNLGVDGKIDIDNTANSTSNTTGSFTTSGGAGIKKSVTIGEKLTVHGDTSITGSLAHGTLTSAITHTGLTANLVSGELYITDTGMTAAPNTSFSNNVTIVGDLTVQGTTALSSDNALSLNVASMTTLSVSAETTLDGNTTIGDNSGDEHLFVLAPVGNSTVGFIPNGNTVLLGDTSNRWKLNANTINTSGAITTSGGVLPTSNTAGAVLGSSAQRFKITANTGSFSGALSTAQSASVGTTLSAGNTTITGFINVSSTSQFDDIVTAGSSVNITGQSNSDTLRARGHTDLESSANVTGDLSIHSDIKDDGGNAFRIYYANGDVAWPA